MSLRCQHVRTSLVRAWDGGVPFVAVQCDACGAVGPASEEDRAVDPFALPEMDLKMLQRHGKDVDAEIRRLENLLRPGNPQITLALDGALLNDAKGR